MVTELTQRQIEPTLTAVVRDRIELPDFGRQITQVVLPRVYAFLKERKIHPIGFNVILYPELHFRHGAPVEIGVQVFAPFEGNGDVVCSQLPGGRIATAIHRGSYDGLDGAHQVIRQTIARENLPLAGPKWEIYGHWNDDPAKLETEIVHLLA